MSTGNLEVGWHAVWRLGGLEAGMLLAMMSVGMMMLTNDDHERWEEFLHA